DSVTIREVIFYGHDAVYVVQPDDGPVIRSRVLATPTFRPGDRVEMKYSGRATVGFPGAG
ncbi:MAG: TOBE domain-containing protein, partial [Actinomycetota bacterium]